MHYNDHEGSFHMCLSIIVAKCKYAKFIVIFKNWMENQLGIHAHARFQKRFEVEAMYFIKSSMSLICYNYIILACDNCDLLMNYVITNNKPLRQFTIIIDVSIN